MLARLTEKEFKELYGLALELRNADARGAAREIFLLLFDHGRTAGGYGVVRLSFVLRQLAELAELDPGDVESQRAREALDARRAEREAAILRGEAGFVEIQELVAIDHCLGQIDLSHALLKRLAKADDPQLATAQRTLNRLLLDELTLGKAAELAWEILRERLKARILELAAAVKQLAMDACLERNEEREELLAESARLAAEIRPLADRDPPAEEKQDTSPELAGLREDIRSLLERHRIAENGLRQADSTKLVRITKELSELVQSHKLRDTPPADQELVEQVVNLATNVARRISEERIREDFTESSEADRGAHAGVATRILGDGLTAYKVLLRIGEDTLAEKVEAWLLAFRPESEVYSRLIEAATWARKPAMAARLREEARRLLAG